MPVPGLRAHLGVRQAVRVLAVAAFAGGLLVAVTLADLAGGAFFVAYGGIGAYLAIQRPRNPIGWLLMGTGWGLCIGSAPLELPRETLLAGSLDPWQTFVAWANGCGWSIAFACFFSLALVFPSGSMPRGRVRWPARITLLAMVGLAGLMWTAPALSLTLSPNGASVVAPNPIAVASSSPLWDIYPGPDATYAIMFGLMVLSVLALIGRYRRSVGLERLQYRWLVTAIVLVAVTNFIWAVATFGFDVNQFAITWTAVVVAYLSVPVAVAVAIQRYRLYDIDRIISRSIAYGIVTVLVAGVFGLGILLISSTLGSVAEGQSIAVAGATLLACAVAQPALRRIRSVVDRRFDRARYDADRTAISFSARLRDETDVEAVTDDLIATARTTVAPTTTSVWIRSPAAGAPR